MGTGAQLGTARSRGQREQGTSDGDWQHDRDWRERGLARQRGLVRERGQRDGDWRARGLARQGLARSGDSAAGTGATGLARNGDWRDRGLARTGTGRGQGLARRGLARQGLARDCTGTATGTGRDRDWRERGLRDGDWRDGDWRDGDWRAAGTGAQRGIGAEMGRDRRTGRRGDRQTWDRQTWVGAGRHGDRQTRGRTDTGSDRGQDSCQRRTEHPPQSGTAYRACGRVTGQAETRSDRDEARQRRGQAEGRAVFSGRTRSPP